jgi:hypothetical protein
MRDGIPKPEETRAIEMRRRVFFVLGLFTFGSALLALRLGCRGGLTSVDRRVAADASVAAYRQYRTSGGRQRDTKFGEAVNALSKLLVEGAEIREAHLIYAIGEPDRKSSRNGSTFLEYDPRGLGNKTMIFEFGRDGILRREVSLAPWSPPTTSNNEEREQVWP